MAGPLIRVPTRTIVTSITWTGPVHTPPLSATIRSDDLTSAIMMIGGIQDVIWEAALGSVKPRKTIGLLS